MMKNGVVLTFKYIVTLMIFDPFNAVIKPQKGYLHVRQLGGGVDPNYAL